MFVQKCKSLATVLANLFESGPTFGGTAGKFHNPYLAHRTVDVAVEREVSGHEYPHQLDQRRLRQA